MMPMTNKPWRTAYWFGLALLITALDWVTKAWAMAALTLHQRVEILPFFNLTLIHNPGAAFGLFANGGELRHWFFLVVTIGLSGVIAVWLATGTRDKPLLAGALTLVLGGALGNLIDRIRFGYVIDFLDFHAFGWHWPAFNVADAAITCGALLLITSTLLGRD